MCMELNEMIEARYELAIERIREIGQSDETGVYKDYFDAASEFILKLDHIYRLRRDGKYEGLSLEELKSLNHGLYGDILDGKYEKSFANPDYCEKCYGKDMGALLCVLYTEVRACIAFCFEGKREAYTAVLELFIQVYCECAADAAAKDVHDTIYWHISDYCDVILADRVYEQVSKEPSKAVDIVMNADLSDLRHLYYYGEYISDIELETAKYMNKLPKEVVDKLADTFVNGYVRGFELTGKDITIKNVCDIRYNLGFERIIRSAVKKLEAVPLKPVIYRGALDIINRGDQRIGYVSCSANRQFDYDHRHDIALFLDKELNDRRLAVIKATYEAHKEEARGYAGPAVLEVFGESVFEPANKESAIKYDSKTSKYRLDYMVGKGNLVNEYIHSDERSFTIMALPLPCIGKDFERIFDEVVKLNTLEQSEYERIQNIIIDVLDEADYVRVKGMNGNRTDLRVSLMRLENPESETKFENCLADVNIPLGEVFTSPKLSGTCGVLHVKRVHLEGVEYKDLEIYFEDGFTKKVSCGNYEGEKGAKFVRDNILFDHDSLPMGEFAIGTNTVAYTMARRYGIEKYMPILIAEKTGPHFAVGDTCYSRSEDIRVYNPNGKEIVSRDNEHTLKYRKDAPKKAYFNCHTDITIPYDELGELCAVKKADGKEEVTTIIKDGRFVLDGLSLLNEPLD